MLRIGRISYANCTPIFHALQQHAPCDTYHFTQGVPAQLNAMLSAGEIDVCPSSSIEYAHHSGHYLILPDLSISSSGSVGSVLLFSRIAIEELDGHSILLSSESATSVNLLRILMTMRFGYKCTYSVSGLPLAKALQAAPAMLLIGDAALRSSLEASDLFMYDLGKLWNDWTGLPFVFALWLCGRKAAEERYAEVYRLACDLIAAKENASGAFEEIAQSSPESAWMGKERLITYWRDNISYDLGQRHLEGLALFYRYCTELGLLKGEPVLHLLNTDSERG